MSHFFDLDHFFHSPPGFLFFATHGFVWTVVALTLLAIAIHALALLGALGRAIGDWLTHAPGLDLIVTIFTVLPLFVGPILWGWGGFVGAVLGQYATLIVWTICHELAHPSVRRGPRIYKVNNKMVGMVPNLIGCFITSFAVPTFWIVRVTELTVYPAVRVFVNMPKYNQREWVNVSRQKFTGLIGHDLIWCLYCDWMTGIWSLGSEMLRNIESFWCPIRFSDKAKCDNCTLDFPDVDGGWTPANGTIADAAATVEKYYLAEPKPPTNAWLGHPVRLTVKGKAPTE
jgi:hypothetical protein